MPAFGSKPLLPGVSGTNVTSLEAIYHALDNFFTCSTLKELWRDFLMYKIGSPLNVHRRLLFPGFCLIPGNGFTTQGVEKRCLLDKAKEQTSVCLFLCAAISSSLSKEAGPSLFCFQLWKITLYLQSCTIFKYNFEVLVMCLIGALLQMKLSNNKIIQKLRSIPVY